MFSSYARHQWQIIGGGAGLTVGALPSLPTSYDILVTNATEYRNAITGAPAAGTTYYIAVQDGAVIDLGSTNISTGGFTDYTVAHSKDIVVAPESWYAGNFTYTSDPFGDGNNYTRMVVRPCTIIGWHRFSSGNPEMYGMKRTISLYPTAPTSSTFERWADIGIQDGSFLDTYTGSGSPNFSWNEYYIGKDVSHTAFDPTVKEYDMRSPDLWCFATDGTNVRCRLLNVSVTSGSNVLTVNSITNGAMAIAIGQHVTYNNGSTVVRTTITGLGTGTGGTGTYTMLDNAPATLSNIACTTSTKANQNGSTQADFTLTGWGDTDFPEYNRFSKMPSAIWLGGDNAGIGTQWTGASGTMSYNYMRDLYDGIRMKNERAGDVTFNNTDNYMTRLYHDYNRFNFGNASVQLVVNWMRNIYINPIANGYDGGNPHGDMGQAYGENTGTTTGNALAHWRSIGNFAFIEPTCRGVFQGHYFQMNYDHYLLGMLVKDNVGIGTNKFIYGGAQHSTWVRNSIGITQEASRPNNDPVNPNTAGWYSSIYVNRAPASVSLENSQMRIENSVAERLFTTSGFNTLSYETYRTPIVGAWSLSRDTSGIFTDLNRATPTINDMFLAAKELKGTAGTDGLSVATLAEMMALTETNDIAAHFIPQAGITPSATVTTSKGYIHGIAGTTVSVVPDSGVSWETYDPWTGSVVRAMATGTANATVGQKISWQGPASASYLTETALGGTIGGASCRARVITAPNSFYTTADNQVTAYSRIAKPTDARTFRGFVVALIGLKVDTWTNGAVVMADKNTNGYARIGLSTLGSGRLNTQWLGSTATEGGSTANFDVGTDTTNRHTYLFAGDFSQTNSADVIKCVKDYTLQAHGGTESINTLGTETFSIGDFFGASGIGLFDVYAGTSTNLDGSIQGLWINLYEDPLDIPDITNVDVINAFTRDMLDVNGDGSVTGVLTQPLVFIQGPVGATDGSTANSWNATGGITNLGTGGGAMIKQTGTYA